jgi:hypothetical protein
VALVTLGQPTVVVAPLCELYVNRYTHQVHRNHPAGTESKIRCLSTLRVQSTRASRWDTLFACELYVNMTKFRQKERAYGFP